MTDDRDPSDDEAAVGHRRPPVSGRFRKGQSGNSRGRPRGSHRTAPYDAVLGQMVTIREDGVGRKVTAEEAFLLQVTKLGLEGDGAAARAMAQALEEARALPRHQSGTSPSTIVVQMVESGSVTSALEPLRMAKKLFRYRSNAQMKLEPWLVQAALERLGGRRLSLAEQETVVLATKAPDKVKWPEWWEVVSPDVV